MHLCILFCFLAPQHISNHTVSNYNISIFLSPSRHGLERAVQAHHEVDRPKAGVSQSEGTVRACRHQCDQTRIMISVTEVPKR